MMIRPLAFLVLFFPAFLPLALTGCGKEEVEPSVERIVEYRDRPQASVAGTLGLPDGVEPFGVMVYAEGTSHVAFTGEEGNYLISGLMPGDYRIRAAREDLESQVIGSITVTESDLMRDQPFHEFARVLMDLKPDRDPQMRAIQEARRTATIRGVVRTEVPGEEGGVLVSAQGTPARTATLPDGSFELYRLDPGRIDLHFSKPGYDDVARSVVVEAGQVLELPPVQMSGATHIARVGRTIYGQVEVLTADGHVPQDYGLVRVILEGTSYMAAPNQEGRFEIRNVPAGIYVVSASLPGYLLDNKVRVDLESVAAAEANLTLLEDTTEEMMRGSIAGRVRLQDPPESGLGGVGVSLIGSNQIAFTARDGTYRLENIEPGIYELMASYPGYESAYVEGIRVEAGNITEVEELVLEKEMERPRVVVTNPANGARDVTIEQPTYVMIQFSMPMNTESVRNAIRIQPEVDWEINTPPGVQRGQDSFFLELNAVPGDGRNWLRYGTRYNIEVAASASNVDGVTMEDPYRFSFTTGHPKIIATTPADGSRDGVFFFDEPILVYFNAPIDRESVSSDNITFTPDLPGRPNVLFRRDPQTGWTILHIQGRGEYDTRYRVRISGPVRTITGQRISNIPYSWSFTTRRLRTFEDVYDTGSLDYDERERERDRQR